MNDHDWGSAVICLPEKHMGLSPKLFAFVFKIFLKVISIHNMRL